MRKSLLYIVLALALFQVFNAMSISLIEEKWRFQLTGLESPGNALLMVIFAAACVGIMQLTLLLRSMGRVTTICGGTLIGAIGLIVVYLAMEILITIGGQYPVTLREAMAEPFDGKFGVSLDVSCVIVALLSTLIGMKIASRGTESKFGDLPIVVTGAEPIRRGWRQFFRRRERSDMQFEGAPAS